MSLTHQKYLSADERDHLETLLEKYRHTQPRNTLMLAMMLYCGFRPRELLNLTWGDLDLKSGTVHIKTIKKGRDRLLPLHQGLIKRLSAFNPGPTEDRVFKISYGHFARIWGMYRPAAKGLHCLRHTFAVQTYRRSNNLKLVQKSLGHRHLSTTDVYLDFEQGMDELRKALC